MDKDKHILHTFKQAGIQVRVWDEGKPYPWRLGKPLPCPYAGKVRMTSPQACQRHQDQRSPLCEGCGKATWVISENHPLEPLRTAGTQAQGKLFT